MDSVHTVALTLFVAHTPRKSHSSYGANANLGFNPGRKEQNAAENGRTPVHPVMGPCVKVYVNRDPR
jgi:hypothetical protein